MSKHIEAKYSLKRTIDYIAERGLIKPGITPEEGERICHAADYAFKIVTSSAWPITDPIPRRAIGDLFRAVGLVPGGDTTTTTEPKP